MLNTIIINGKEIKTNYNDASDYSICAGNYKKTMKMESAKWGEYDKDMLERLSYWYSKITFYKVATRVRGITELIAYCK